MLRAPSGHSRVSSLVRAIQVSPRLLHDAVLRRHAVLAINNNAQRLAQVLLADRAPAYRHSALPSARSWPDRPASTVSLLVRIAWLCARRRCTSRRACGEVIHWLSPFAIAVRPSSDAPSLSWIKGNRCAYASGSLYSAFPASCIIRPWLTSMPSCCRRYKPRPATCGLGSCMAATTRETPAAISASQHGGVRPWWLQGSSVT